MKVILRAITQEVSGLSLTFEEAIIHDARVTTPDNRLNHETAPKLLRFLIDSNHWSPFETGSIKFEIETSRAIAQQLLRHRSFSFQEFSQRYAKVEAMENFELRYQAEKNRQSSTGRYTNMSLIKESYILIDKIQNLYERLVNDGVAKETARMILPLTTQTTLIMHGTLRSWIHFLDQRCDDHAQKEIRLIAKEIKLQLSKICPWTAKALNWCQPVKIIPTQCKHFIDQKDSNGEIAICYCKHELNKSECEGNCIPSLCPIVNDIDWSN